MLAAQSDGVLLTFDVRKTRRVDLQRTMHSLETVGARVLGVVMNNVKSDKQGSR
jgi:Mrp family chromosome partitioning ATPase